MVLALLTKKSYNISPLGQFFLSAALRIGSLAMCRAVFVCFGVATGVEAGSMGAVM